MKNINLMISRLPLPAAGPALDFGDMAADAGYVDEAEVLDERGGPPLFVRGSILLTFLIAGVILLAGGAYYTLIRPLDFSGTPTPAPVKRAAVGPRERAASIPAVRSPSPPRPMAQMNDASPPTRPVSPGAKRAIEKPGAPPPPSPAKKPSPGVPAAVLAMTGTGDKERKSPVAGPPSDELKMETPDPTIKASIAPGPAPEAAKPAPAPPPESAKRVEKRPKAAKDKARPLAKQKARMTSSPAMKADRVVRKRRGPSKPPRVARARAGRYSIQVGACRTAKCVEGLGRRLKEAGLEPMTAKSKSGKLTFVRTGIYPTWAAVIAELKKVKIRGFKDSYAVKR